MKSQKLFFDNGRGERLTARLDLPEDKEADEFALFAHCFTCTMNLKAIANISRALTAAGIAVLRFDFTGLGESEGDFADTNFTFNARDLVAAADYLDSEYRAPRILIGPPSEELRFVGYRGSPAYVPTGFSVCRASDSRVGGSIPSQLTAKQERGT